MDVAGLGNLGAVLRWYEHALVALVRVPLKFDFIRLVADLFGDPGWSMVVLTVLGLSSKSQSFLLTGRLVKVNFGLHL